LGRFHLSAQRQGVTKGPAGGLARSSAAIGLNRTTLSTVSELARAHLSREAGVPKPDDVLRRPAARPKLELLIDTGRRAASIGGKADERAPGNERLS